MIPQKIGRYQIKDELGAGGMGIVYRAYDPNLLRDVALKMLFQGQFRRLSDTKQQEILARFQQEAKIIASLHHVAIMPVYDFGWENGEPFIVMPLMSGGGLDERLEAEPLALDEIVRILDCIAPALDTVHQRGIIHRDLKPSNILFNEDNNPNIADFGVARLTEETMRLSQTGAAVGTPAYMSPEQGLGDKDIDQRSDIYSLGCMLFEMLTGERPYHQAHPHYVQFMHVHEPVPRLDELRTDLPPGYQAIIDCAMAKKKEERYGSAGEMAAALKRVVVGTRTRQRLLESLFDLCILLARILKETREKYAKIKSPILHSLGSFGKSLSPRQSNPSQPQTPQTPSVNSNKKPATAYFEQGVKAQELNNDPHNQNKNGGCFYKTLKTVTKIATALIIFFIIMLISIIVVGVFWGCLSQGVC